MIPDRVDAALTALIHRAQGGDRTARDDLMRAAQNQLESLVRRMLRRQPGVGRWMDTMDVYQNAAVRLLRALESTPIADSREFFNLAAALIRRELIDLARRFLGPRGQGANHQSTASGGTGMPERDARDNPAELERWTLLHEAIERLPTAEREVFGLTLYHGWSQEQIAELFGVDVRTVRRRWRAAVESLHSTLGGEFPEG